MLVADSPVTEDLTTGYALSGYKEYQLREFSKNAGLSYDQFYRTCLVKDKLESPRSKKKNISEIEDCSIQLKSVVPEYSEIFLDEVRTLKPNLIVPLGELSFQFLTGLQSIRKFRGSIIKLNAIHQIEKYTKILPILGPYPYLNKEYSLKFITQIDFQKIPKWSGPELIPDEVFRIWIAKSYVELRAFIDRCYGPCAARPVSEGGFLVFDIETYMNIPTCISFCFDGVESVCVPILDSTIPFTERVLLIQLIAKLLASPIPKVNQNIKYDWKTQERWRFRVNQIVGDTMLASSTLYCEFPKNLGFLTSIYTDIPYFKDEGRQFDPSQHKKEQFYLYNAKDSLATHQIYSKQIPELTELGVQPVYEKLIQLMPIYRKMEDNGIRIDETCCLKLLNKYEILFRIHTLNLCRLVNEDNLNPLSSHICNRIVFEELGYKKIQGVEGTDEESLNMLMAFGRPQGSPIIGKQILREIIYCRKIHKVIEILELPLYPDGRFRCEFNLTGTITGRTSAGKTTDYFIIDEKDSKGRQKIKKINLGHSLQTIGKHGFRINGELYGTDIRDMFVASPGYSFMEIDLSGAEARVDRVLSGIFDMEVFDNPGIHKLTGSWIFDCKPSAIVKGSLEYHLSKTVRHAGERNMRVDRFFLMAQDEGTGINLTLEKAKTILEKFHKVQPEIQQVYHKEIELAIRTTRCLVAPNGRRRDFFDRINHSSINSGISYLPQVIVSDQTKFSFIPTFCAAPWARLLAESHDSGFAEVPRGREHEFYQIYKKNVEVPIDFRNGSLKRDYQLVIPADGTVGPNWGHMEDIKEIND
jgi:uracil-DNA glycosylase